MSCVVLLSGGMDSATVAGWAFEVLPKIAGPGAEPVAAVFCDYGQRHIREREAASTIAAHYALPLYEVDLRAYGESVTSVLTQHHLSLPTGHYSDENMAATVVPGRNAVMLSVAAGIAVSVNADTVLCAVHAGDHPIYPDCRPEFVTAIDTALHRGYGVHVQAPFVGVTKAHIVRIGTGLGVPYADTWSCYAGGEVHCGRCGTCVERAEAFALAQVPDPTRYLAPDYWKEVTAP